MQIPTKTTLKKYGLDASRWTAIYLQQGGLCACCEAPFDDEKGNKLRNSYVDHEHVKGFKQMKPEDKRKYIRGILCYQCNFKLLEKSNTLTRLGQGINYLMRYEKFKELSK